IKSPIGYKSITARGHKRDIVNMGRPEKQEAVAIPGARGVSMNMIGLLLAGLLSVQQGRTGSVEGIVLRAGTSQSISKAVVELSGNNLSEALVMATGGDGKFEFRNLAPGRYRLGVSRDGYLNSSYGQRGPNGN